MMRALGTSPRRIFLSGITGAGIALTGNLFGVTSQLLTLVPEDTVEATGLDTYFPRGPYKRFKTADYTFAMPREWVADTAIELAKAQRRSMSLDYSLRSKPISSGVLPDAGESQQDYSFQPWMGPLTGSCHMFSYFWSRSPLLLFQRCC
jgi:hypothetical protein